MRFETDTKAGTMMMRGPIGDFDGGISADDFRDSLKEHNGADVTIELDSEGGSVSDGLAIYNAIMTYEGKVTIHIDTIAASIATVICCAADHVIINSNAKYMIHRCWTQAMGNCRDFRSTADIMEMLDADMASTYAEKTNIDSTELTALMDAETWFSAEEAVARGFADEIHVIARKARASDAIHREVKAYSPFAVSAKAGAVAKRMKLKLNK